MRQTWDRRWHEACAGARRVAGIAEHHQLDFVAAVPIQVAAGGGGALDPGTARSVFEQALHHPSPSLPPPIAAAAPMQTADVNSPSTAMVTSLLDMMLSRRNNDYEYGPSRRYGVQPLGIGVQIDVARAGNVNLGFVGGGDVGVAAAGDVHFATLEATGRGRVAGARDRISAFSTLRRP
jgi:hypothetical protein